MYVDEPTSLHRTALFISTGPRSPTKRSRLSIDQCFPAEDASRASAMLLDPCTIDINENTEPTSYSPTTHDSMANAVKMVQPIVDIIFNAFEDQLKTTEKQQLLQSMGSYSPRVTGIPSVAPCSIYPPTVYPCCSSIQPVILHSVHFTIQLTSERQPTIVRHREITDQSSLPNVAARNSDHSLSLSFTDLKQRLMSKIIANKSETETDEHQFKRMMQLAVVGMSALCGYWFF